MPLPVPRRSLQRHANLLLQLGVETPNVLLDHYYVLSLIQEYIHLISVGGIIVILTRMQFNWPSYERSTKCTSVSKTRHSGRTFTLLED